jgi:threonine-phosphate decarboxylase
MNQQERCISNIYRLAEELNVQERTILDFSTISNPLRVSKKIKAEIRKHLKYLYTYPDPEAGRLRKRLAQYHGIDRKAILCGNGSTELIHLIARTLQPQSILLPAPTYSEYERAVSLVGGRERNIQIGHMVLKGEQGFRINPDELVAVLQKGLNTPRETHQAPRSYDMLFLSNPNNPTGKLLKKDAVHEIADAAREMKCFLIVDEAYIDFCTDESVIKDVERNPYLIVLRSLSGFYALAGLRIGYGVFPQQLIPKLQEQKEPWTVNNLSQRAAVIALKDKAFRKESLKIIKEEKKFLEKSFQKIGIEFLKSDAHFYLVKIDNAHEVCKQLRRKSILVRSCENVRGLDSSYIRIAVKSHKENTLLIKELTSILNHSRASRGIG